ncbi:alcohol dehydrogenase catalytic domain-containing protein [Nocardia amikacinitolerans]|uniref:alcohol dehydrogenase catalytic domain-containing protein n=1 Tax=Nocardia amikacinitolerans TaxID=756689 RepID=UPI0020A6047A|nr:alcohol dehydrogenase catalytic domain-containing protein [Nocardia amikacinitolerans]
MHAIRLHAFGPAENLRYDTLPDPEPGPGQVRVAVAAAGVHVVDTALRRGMPGPYPSPELPTVPGREVAGTVDRVGADVDPDWLGKPVVAHLGAAPGGYAELAVVEADRREVPRAWYLRGTIGWWPTSGGTALSRFWRWPGSSATR